MGKESKDEDEQEPGVESPFHSLTYINVYKLLTNLRLFVNTNTITSTSFETYIQDI